MALRRALAASVTGRYLGLLVGILSSIVVARLLSPEQVGIFSIALAVASITTAIRHFGGADYLVQLPELDRRDMARVSGLALGVTLPIIVMVWAFRGVVARWYGEPELAFLQELLMVSILLMSLGIPVIAVLQREFAFATLQAVQLSASVAGASAAITLAILGHGPASLAYGRVVSGAVHIAARARVRPRLVFFCRYSPGSAPCSASG
jgi:O-antigen/teichoic acid export membrane protein